MAHGLPRFWKPKSAAWSRLRRLSGSRKNRRAQNRASQGLEGHRSPKKGQKTAAPCHGRKSHATPQVLPWQQPLQGKTKKASKTHSRSTADAWGYAFYWRFLPRPRFCQVLPSGSGSGLFSARACACARRGSATSSFSRGVRGFYIVQQRRSPALVRRHPKEGPCAPRGWPSPASCVLPACTPSCVPAWLLARPAGCFVALPSGGKGSRFSLRGALPAKEGTLWRTFSVTCWLLRPAPCLPPW